jgi:hypothetical protein
LPVMYTVIRSQGLWRPFRGLDVPPQELVLARKVHAPLTNAVMLIRWAGPMSRYVTFRKALAKHRRLYALPAPVRILQAVDRRQQFPESP